MSEPNFYLPYPPPADPDRQVVEWRRNLSDALEVIRKAIGAIDVYVPTPEDPGPIGFNFRYGLRDLSYNNCSMPIFATGANAGVWARASVAAPTVFHQRRGAMWVPVPAGGRGTDTIGDLPRASVPRINGSYDHGPIIYVPDGASVNHGKFWLTCKSLATIRVIEPIGTFAYVDYTPTAGYGAAQEINFSTELMKYDAANDLVWIVDNTKRHLFSVDPATMQVVHDFLDPTSGSSYEIRCIEPRDAATIYVTDTNSRTYELDIATGATTLCFPSPGFVCCSLLYLEDEQLLITGEEAGSARVTCYDAANSYAQLWQNSATANSYAPLVYDPQYRLIYRGSNVGIVIYDLVTGGQTMASNSGKWMFDLITTNAQVCLDLENREMLVHGFGDTVCVLK